MNKPNSEEGGVDFLVREGLISEVKVITSVSYKCG